MSKGPSVPPLGNLAGPDTPCLEAGSFMSKGLSMLPLDALLVHECGNVVLDMLHVLVDCRDALGAFPQPTANVVQCRALGIEHPLVLVAQGMLQRAPKVHRNGAELHFHNHLAADAIEIHGNAHDKMEAAIARLFGVLDLVLALQELYVPLA